MGKFHLVSALTILFIVGVSARDSETDTSLKQVAGALEMYVDELPNMPKLRASRLTIGMYQKSWKFHRDLPASTVFAYGTSLKAATVPGPTIEAKHDVPTKVRWENHLPPCHFLPWDPTITHAKPKVGGVPTVVHLHGGVQESRFDGNALAWFTAGFKETGPAWTTTTYLYPNVQHPGNLWYHDHALGLTRVNVLAGLLGAYVIRNPWVENPLGFPTGDNFDRHLVIFDRSFRTDGSIYINSTGDNPSIHPQWQPEYFGDAMIVNGKAWPFLTVKPRKYRFRIINASNARFFRFTLSNGDSFIQVGSDTSYLKKPVRTKSIILAPSEIADVIIDFSFSPESEIELINDAPYPYPTGESVDHLNSKIMKFIVLSEDPRYRENFVIPMKGINYPVASFSDATLTRYITMYEYMSPVGTSTHLYINGKKFNDPVTEKPKSGSTELWHVINLTGDNHPLHIHLASFQAIEARKIINLAGFTECMRTKNDALTCNITSQATGKVIHPPKNERTWKNALKLHPGYMTSVVVKFNLVDSNAPYPFDATTEPGYVYHCHILDHEDNEMIRPLKLV